jgi:hypothetical protein
MAEISTRGLSSELVWMCVGVFVCGVVSGLEGVSGVTERARWETPTRTTRARRITRTTRRTT